MTNRLLTPDEIIERVDAVITAVALENKMDKYEFMKSVLDAYWLGSGLGEDMTTSGSRPSV